MKKNIFNYFKLNNKKFVFGLLLIFFVSILSFNFVNAAGNARVYLKTSSTSFSNQSDFYIDVSVDTTEKINALNLQISYPPDKIEYIDSTIDHSMVSFWQSGSVLLSKGHIRLAGGMIPSFSGVSGHVTTIHFKAINTGDSKIAIEQGGLYLSDGNGTRISFDSSPLLFNVNNSSPLLEAFPASTAEASITMSPDATPPVLVVRTVYDSISKNNLIVYHSEDPESGVRIVEMRVNSFGSWSEWQAIKNPTVYPKGSLGVEIRSINKNGNITTQAVSISTSFQKTILIIPIIFITIIFLWVYNRNRQRPKI